MPARPSTLPPPARKKSYVREMFSAIAPRYDLLNHLLTLNLDRRWRRQAVARLDWQNRPEGLFLDACAGTFDLGLALDSSLGFRGRVVASDFALPMLQRGARKARGTRVLPAGADSLELPFGDATFDGAMVGWGMRNLSDLTAGFIELLRVLKPAARLVVLDSSPAPRSALRPLVMLYFERVLPFVGRVISGHPTAYSYLPASVGEFPPAAELKSIMEQAAFKDCGFEMLTAGCVAIHWGSK